MPALTMVIVHISDFFVKFWWLILIVGALLFIAGVYELIFGIREMIEQNKNKGERKPAKKAKKKDEPKKEEVKELDYTKKD